MRALVQLPQTRTDRSARVLFETSPARVHDGAHIAGLLALGSDRDFAGGPHVGTGVANARGNRAFGHPDASLDPSRWDTLLDVYNIRWMLYHRVGCKAGMASLPDARETARICPVTAYERARSPGFVVEGSARVVERCVNRVVIDDVTGPRLALRYQWIDGPGSFPTGPVVSVQITPGVPPFAAIVDPPRHLVLRVGNGPGVPCAARERRDPIGLE